jgi:hypothetical protein
MILVKEGDVDIGKLSVLYETPGKRANVYQEETLPPRRWRRPSRAVPSRRTTSFTLSDFSRPLSTRRYVIFIHIKSCASRGPCDFLWCNLRRRTTADFQSYLTYLKGYMKTIKTQLQASNPDRVAAFEKGAQEFAKKIVGNFKDYEFYVGESMNPEGMVVLLVR